MGIFSTLFGSHNYEAVKFIKIKTGFVCNNSYIDLREMEQVAIREARNIDFDLPRVLKRSPLTMVGEFKYLMNIYEGENDNSAMEKIAQAVMLFMNEYGNTLPIDVDMIFRSCMPTELYLEAKSKYGK